MDMYDETKPLVQKTPELSYVYTEKRLKQRPKCCYGIGGIPYPLTANVVAFYISIFLLDVAQIRPLYASIIIFSGKAWDAITDPTLGIVLDRVETRFGKIKPWLVLSTPFGVASYIFLWYVPDIGDTSKVVYYLICYCAYQTFLTCYHLPYVAMTMYLSNEAKDRDSATAYRMTCEVFGTVLGVVLQAQFLTIGNAMDDSLDPCDGQNTTGIPTLAPDQRDTTEMAYLISAVVIGFIFIICCIVVTIGTKEIKDDAVEKTDVGESFCESLKIVLSHGPYVKLLMCFLCTSLALQIIQGNLALYFLYALDYENFQFALIVVLVTALVFLPLWQLLAKRIGKKSALAIGLIGQIPIYISLYFALDEVAIIYGLSVISGAFLGTMYLLPWSMIPDVIDDFTLKTGCRKEAIFYSFYVFFTKFAVGITLGISTLVLEFAGYVSGACEQPESVGFALRLLVSAAPVTLILLGLFFLWIYPITEIRRSETRTKLYEIRERNRASLANLPLAMPSDTETSNLDTISDSVEICTEDKSQAVMFSVAGQKSQNTGF